MCEGSSRWAVKKAALERLPLYYAISSSQVFRSSTDA